MTKTKDYHKLAEIHYSTAMFHFLCDQVAAGNPHAKRLLAKVEAWRDRMLDADKEIIDRDWRNQ